MIGNRAASSTLTPRDREPAARATGLDIAPALSVVIPVHDEEANIVPLLNEAMHMVMEGVATAHDVDIALRLGFGFELGPLALADRIGLDQVLMWMESLFHELGELKYLPCPLLRKMVRAGHLGVKNGRGFFLYPG